MYDHVYRTIVVGTISAPAVEASDSLVTRLQPTGFERYTGLIVFAPDVRLAVLEGPAALHTLQRHALRLAGLAAGQTLLTQRTSFRWFSALMLQQHDTAPPGFSMAELTTLAKLPPRKLYHHIETLARLGERPQLYPASESASSDAADLDDAALRAAQRRIRARVLPIR
jgi:hypothetical protein